MHVQGIMQRAVKAMRRDKALIIMILPVVAFFVIFSYIPMAGLTMAFQDYVPRRGFFGSEWVGLQWFKEFFSSFYIARLIRNTVLISFFSLIIGFPLPIIFALLLNELRSLRFKKTVQTVSYMPYFISTVVLVGIMKLMMNSPDGIIVRIIGAMGGEQTNFFMEPGKFRLIYIASGIWQDLGFSSILYIAVLTSISPEIYESAVIDGANRFQQMIHISIPSMRTTIGTMLILSIGGLFSVGFEKIILIYNPATYETADVISTYVYRRGIQNSEFSFATAVGLFNSVVNFTLLFVTNLISKRVTEVSIW